MSITNQINVKKETSPTQFLKGVSYNIWGKTFSQSSQKLMTDQQAIIGKLEKISIEIQPHSIYNSDNLQK